MSRSFAYRAALVALLAATLACSTVTDLINQGRSAQSTVEAFATEGNALAATAQALATEIDPAGLEATAEALATEFEAGGLEATVEALATQAAPGDLPTLPPLATPGPFDQGEAPADIPVMDGEKEFFFGSDEVVSYFIQAGFADVLDFYKTEMPANNWTLVPDQTIESGDTALLTYEKADKTALVTISRDAAQAQTVVQVLIQPK